MIPGITVAIGGVDFVVPPLSIAQLRQFLPRVQHVAGLDATQMGEAQLEALVAIITAALQRNYPEVTTAKVEEILDLGNALPVLNAILGGIKSPAEDLKHIVTTRGIGTGELIAEDLKHIVTTRGIGAGELIGRGNEPAAPNALPDPQNDPDAAAPYDNPWRPNPWRPNPPVVGS